MLPAVDDIDDRAVSEFYRHALSALNTARIPYLVGGAYAFEWVTKMAHRHNDLDLFVRRRDCQAVLATFATLGCRTERTHPHWLAKAHWDDQYVDVIFNSGNGQAPVDDSWFEHALHGTLADIPVSFCPIEETIWTKAYIMERERYDGADVAHLLRASAERLDWGRLLRRFGDHASVLLSHLLLFGFIYPGERRRIPAWVVRELTARSAEEWEAAVAEPRLCRGGFLSRAQYVVDMQDWGYLDARVFPFGRMTAAEADTWSGAAPASGVRRAALSARIRG